MMRDMKFHLSEERRLFLPIGLLTVSVRPHYTEVVLNFLTF